MKLERLEVYQISMELADRVYKIASMWKPLDLYSLGTQMVKSADSVPGNIAEGYGRFSGMDNRKFTMYARGSLFELSTQLKLAHERGLISETDFEAIGNEINRLIPMLIKYSRSIPLGTRV